VDEILRTALASEKAKLLLMLSDAAPARRMALLEEIAACESLLGRLSQHGAPNQILDGPLPNEGHADPLC
jgi:hypothetical protein